jgi:hypothetical protein
MGPYENLIKAFLALLLTISLCVRPNCEPAYLFGFAEIIAQKDDNLLLNLLSGLESLIVA